MFKKIGIQLVFIAVLIGIVFLLQPQLFNNILGQSSEEERETESKGKTTNQPKSDTDSETPPRMSANPKSNLELNIQDDVEEEYTAYAEGYSEEDFGEAFEAPENVLQVDANGELLPPSGVWEDLLTLEFKFKYDASIDDVIFNPQFTARIKKHEGKRIRVDGYIIPFDVVEEVLGDDNDGSVFMLSAYPAQVCFFCGGAGPESIIQVYPTEPIHYTAKRVTLEGVLELNDTDYLNMAYILKRAKFIQ